VDFEDDINALYQTYQDLLPMAEADEARLWKKFRLDWNYNSNRIEGNTLTYGETEALLILGTEPRRLQKDIREMRAHDLAISYVQDLAKSERNITEANIRELNQITLKENYYIETETAEGNITRKEIVPGQYKTTPNHVRLRGGGIHKFAEPHEVSMRVASTVQSIRDYLQKPDNSLPKFLAKLHQDFIQTHPFDDGNGRVVRMLLNYVCLSLDWPPVIIKDNKKSDYLAALERADSGDIADLETLMKQELTWSLKKSIQAARGEDIDDPEDMDKRINILLKEKEEKFQLIENQEKSRREFLAQSFISLDSAVQPRLSSLSQLFKKYKEHSNYDKEISPDIILSRHGKEDIDFFCKHYRLEDWRGSESKYDFVIKITFFDQRDIQYIHTDIQLWQDNTMSKDRLKHVNNKDIADGQLCFHYGEDFEVFSKRILTAIIDEIDLLPMNKSD